MKALFVDVDQLSSGCQLLTKIIIIMIIMIITNDDDDDNNDYYYYLFSVFIESWLVFIIIMITIIALHLEIALDFCSLNSKPPCDTKMQREHCLLIQPTAE